MKNKFIVSVFILIFLCFPFQVFAFSDVAGDGAEQQAIGYVSSQGIVSGYADGTYRPKNFINRAEFTRMVMTWLYKDKIDGANCFPDVRMEWFAPHVCAAKTLLIIQGYKDGTFQPGNNISLVEALKIVTEAKKIVLADQSASALWYQKYWDYAQENPTILQSIQPDPQHQITRGEMASLISNIAHLNTTSSPTSVLNGYGPMTAQQIADFNAIIKKFPQGNSPLENKQYLTQNFANLLSNLVTMATYGQDPQFIATLAHNALINVWAIPDTTIAKLYRAKISAQNAYMMYEIDTPDVYGLSCTTFKNENGWKIDNTSASATMDPTKKTLIRSNMEYECKKNSPVTNLLNEKDLEVSKQTYSSEYAYDIYLNGYLIETGRLKAGLNTHSLPLKNGANELKVVVGKSYKDMIDMTAMDPFSQLAQTLNGFEYSLSVNDKELVNVQITKPNSSLIQMFNYQK